MNLFSVFIWDWCMSEDVHQLQKALKAIEPSELSGQCLASDHYTLSRLLHKTKNQQRRWRWFQMLKRVSIGSAQTRDNLARNHLLAPAWIQLPDWVVQDRLTVMGLWHWVLTRVGVLTAQCVH